MWKKKSVLIGSYYKLSHVDKNFSVKVKNTPTSISGSSHRWIFKVAVGTAMKAITKKISAGLAFLKSIRPFILFDTRMSMYNALVMPCFNYCSTVWGNIGIGLADKIQKLQNRATRILTFLITRYAQMRYWMSLAGKDLKLLG